MHLRRAGGPIRTTPGYDRTMVPLPLERVEALELLAMTMAHLKIAEESADLSPRVPVLMSIRDKLAHALREDQ